MRPSLRLAAATLLLVVAAACGQAASDDASDELKSAPALGATVVASGVDFAVYAKNAERVDLLLFTDPDSGKASKEIQLKRTGDVWSTHVANARPGQYYGYVAWGPNWHYDPHWTPGSSAGYVADVDAAGNRFDPNKVLLDPYARAVHRNHDWSGGSAASGLARAESTWAAAAKCIVVKSGYTWTSNEARFRNARKSLTAPVHGWNDLIIYEVHAKGFTADPSSGVAHPGTWLGVGEKADYLKDLGITAVELLPVFHKSPDGGYWGYQTLSFFAPEFTYASSPDPAQATDEFKAMVDALHQRNIEVILDVVYNHTGEGGLYKAMGTGTADLLSFRGLDNVAYYALDPTHQYYWDDTGVGNQTRANGPAMQKLILDSLEYWATEMHVDGFRFDLAPVLGAPDLAYGNDASWSNAQSVLQKIVDDPALLALNTRIIAEPWSLRPVSYSGRFPTSSTRSDVGWSEWNGGFRDTLRSLANDDNWRLNSTSFGHDAGFFLSGSYDWFNGNGRHPYNSVNLLTVHDGFTLNDLFSFDAKQNGCSALNPSCCPGAPDLATCDAGSGTDDNRSRNWGNEDLKRQLMRDLLTVLAVSPGTPLLLGGDEWMRTQAGNNNAYRADVPANWFNWATWQSADEKNRMHDFVRRLLQFRKDHAYAFAPAAYGAGAPWAWENEAGQPSPDWTSRHLAMHYNDATRGKRIDVLINFEAGPVTFTLPPGVSWVRAIDTQAWFDTAQFVASQSDPHASYNIALQGQASVSGSYGVQGRSVVVLVEQ